LCAGTAFAIANLPASPKRGSDTVKSLLLAGVMMFAITTVCLAEELHWVDGNRATNKCEVVTSHPVVIGDIWFEDGP
jgi:hypothetical protein